ncbi:MAG: single-stranded DNA-binding protein [Pseudomonadota bacterium]
MLGVNKVLLLGWLGQVPELRYTPSQRAMLRLSLATRRIVYDEQGESSEITDWHTLVFKDKLAEYCAHKLTKGCKLYVEGVLEYQRRQHSEFKAAKWMESVVVVSNMQLIDGASAEAYPDDFPELPGYKKNNNE